MARIYKHQKTGVALMRDNYNSNTPFVVMVGNNIVARLDNMGDAFRFYNNTIIQYS